MIFADTTSDLVSAGTQYGPLGWVLAIIVTAAGVWLWRVYIPDRDQCRTNEQREFEERLKTNAELAAAVSKMCEVTATTRLSVDRIELSSRDNGVVISKLVEAVRSVIDGLKVINSGGQMTEQIGAARALLRGIDDETGEHKPVKGE